MLAALDGLGGWSPAPPPHPDCEDRSKSSETEIADLVDAHPHGALIQIMPGMGATLRAEFLATNGDKPLRQVFYRVASLSTQRDPTSRAFHDRKRAQSERHHEPSSP